MKKIVYFEKCFCPLPYLAARDVTFSTLKKSTAQWHHIYTERDMTRRSRPFTNRKKQVPAVRRSVKITNKSENLSSLKLCLTQSSTWLRLINVLYFDCFLRSLILDLYWISVWRWRKDLQVRNSLILLLYGRLSIIPFCICVNNDLKSYLHF